jgi:hypothetical protein
MEESVYGTGLGIFCDGLRAFVSHRVILDWSRVCVCVCVCVCVSVVYLYSQIQINAMGWDVWPYEDITKDNPVGQTQKW